MTVSRISIWVPAVLALLAVSAWVVPHLPTSRVVLAAGADAGTSAIQPKESPMWMKVGDHRFAVSLADNAAGRAFAERLPLSLQMEELNGNEKHARLPAPLPADASRPGTIRAGDLMLYGSDTFVVFYVTFQSQYAYTRIGRVDDPTGLARALGARDVRVAFSRD
jgi:hypothetical protein